MAFVREHCIPCEAGTKIQIKKRLISVLKALKFIKGIK
jgi:hypothetical protein